MITGLSAVLIVCGVLFFTAGTAALIRFPDIRSQVHVLTKADNLGPGLIMVGAAVYLGSWSSAALLAIAWVLQNPNVAAALVGASRPEQLADTVKASGVTLDADTMTAIDEALGDVVERDPAVDTALQVCVPG